MTKKLHFVPELIPLILKGDKYATWRIDDEKDLQVGDIIEFLEHKTEKQFGTAKVTKVIEKSFADFTDEDKKGHELFQNDAEMYQTFSRYYDTKVTPETLVKIVYFDFKK